VATLVRSIQNPLEFNPSDNNSIQSNNTTGSGRNVSLSPYTVRDLQRLRDSVQKMESIARTTRCFCHCMTPGVRFLTMLTQGGRVDGRFAQFAKDNSILGKILQYVHVTDDLRIS